MTEFIIDSMSDLDAAINSSERIIILFSASFSESSIELAKQIETRLENDTSLNQINFIDLSLDDASIEEIAMEMGVSEPGAVFMYRSGVQMKLPQAVNSSNIDQYINDLNLNEELLAAVREEYARTAQGSSLIGGAAAGCCGTGRDYGKVSSVVGYSKEAMDVGGEANLGLGCGTPIDLANIQPNETVLDLGCGAGFDCFVAADALQGTGLYDSPFGSRTASFFLLFRFRHWS